MKINEHFEAYFQSPGKACLRGLDQFVVVTTRDGQIHDFMLQDAAEIAEVCHKAEKNSKGFVRLRSYWADNSKGNAQAKVDFLLDRDTIEVDFPYTTKNGQSLDVDKTTHEDLNLDSDHFEPNSEARFYG